MKLRSTTLEVVKAREMEREMEVKKKSKVAWRIGKGRSNKWSTGIRENRDGVKK